MSIKKNKPSKDSSFFQGYYKPEHPEKYKGEYPIIYRSSWEHKFCIWCDRNSEVIHWASEPFSIKYWNILTKKFHTYYPDFYISMKKDNEIKKYVVEIKPKSQLKKPAPPKKKTAKSLKNYKYIYEAYMKNLCKIDALNKFAKNQNLNVMLLTEDSKIF